MRVYGQSSICTIHRRMKYVVWEICYINNTMESSPNNQKYKLQIAITATAVLALLVIVFLVLSPRKAAKQKTVVTPKVETVSKGYTISESSLNQDWEQQKEQYKKEQERFAKVMSEASDKELFVVLNYSEFGVLFLC